MRHRLKVKVDLLRLILVIAVAAGMLTFGSVFYASSQVQKEQLINATLENNHNYAKKLASSTDEFLRAAQQQMATAAAIVAKDYTNIALLEIEAERLRVNVANNLMPHGGHVTISLGIASWPRDGLSLPEVLKHSDEMLYQAKHAGRNRVEVYQP